MGILSGTKEVLIKAIGLSAVKALQFLGWDSSDPIAPLSLSAGTTHADRTKLAREIGEPLYTPLVMAGVKWLGRTIHEAPLYVVNRNDAGREINRTSKHESVKLMYRPNDYYTGKTLMKAVGASWMLSGNAYILKRRDERFDQVRELFWEPHFTIRARWYGDGINSGNEVPASQREEFIAFYEVYRPKRYFYDYTGYGSDWIKVPTRDVIHFKDGMNPFNQRLGINGLASLVPDIYTDLQRAYFTATVLSNIGMIPFVISPRSERKSISESQAQVLKSHFIDKARKEAGLPVVAGSAIRIDQLGFSPQDMDLNSLAAIPEERVAAVMGPNGYVLGFVPEKSVFSSYVEARRDAYESYLMPLHDYLAEQLTEDLLREWEEDENINLEYDFSTVPAVQEFRAKLFEMWGRAYRDGIAKRKTALAETGQPFDEEEDDVYLQDLETEKEPESRGELLDEDGNERTRPSVPDRGPILGGKQNQR